MSVRYPKPSARAPRVPVRKSLPMPVRSPLLSRFMGYLAAERGLAVNTLEGYRRDLEAALNFFGPRKVDLAAASADDYQSFFRHSSREKKLSTRTVARRVAAVRSLLKFQEVEGRDHLVDAR